MITRRHLLLAAPFVILFAMVIHNLTDTLNQARAEARDVQEIEFGSDDYMVQLMNVTMYAPLSADAVQGLDYSGDPNLTASGEQVVPGKTAAAGPNIPFGTRIYVEGIGWRTVNDRGSAIGPFDIDLAAHTKEESIKFGKQQRLVIIQTPNDNTNNNGEAEAEDTGKNHDETNDDDELED